MSRPPRAIEVHIEELVLHGFAPHDRAAVAGAIEREVQRALATPGGAAAVAHDRHVPHVESGAVAWGTPGGPARIGAAVARAVAGGLKP